MKLSKKRALLIGIGLVELIGLVYILTEMVQMQTNARAQIESVMIALVLNGFILSGMLIWFQARLARSSVDIAVYRQAQEDLRDKVQALQTISEIERTLSSTAALPDKMTRLLEQTMAYLQIDLGYVSLINPATHLIEVVAQQGARDPLQLSAAPMHLEGVAGWIAENDQALAIADVARDARWVSTQTASAEEITSYLGVPIRIDAHAVGMIHLMTRARREFAQEQTDFVETLARQTAIAIQNAQLVQAAHTELVLAQTLQDIGKLLTIETSLPQVLETILDLLGRVVTYDTASIQLLQENGKLELAAGRGYAELESVRQSVQQLDPHIFSSRYTAGQAAIISDTRIDPNWQVLPGLDPIKSWIGVPLLAYGKLLGILNVDSHTPNAYNATIAKTVMAFAAQTTIALANARLNDELQQRANEFTALHEITQELTTAQELDGLLQTIVTRAIALLHASDGGMYLYDAARQDLQAVVSTHPSTPEGTRLKLGEGMAGRVAQTRQPLIVDNYKTWEGRAAQYSVTPLTAVLEVPMLYRGELIGVLAVEELGNTPRKFHDADAQLLSLFAASAAGVVHAARLLAQTQQRAAELEALRQASLSLTSSLDLQTVLDTVLQNILHLSNDAQNTHIYLYENQHLHFGASLWSNGQSGQEYSPPREEGLTYTVARQGKMIVVPDLAQHPVFASPGHPEWQGAIISLPLLSGADVLGVLNVAFAKPRVFDPAEIDILRLFADQAAIAIANARLHQNVQESETRYRTLVDNIPIGIYRVTPGPHGKILLANATHVAIFGYNSLAEMQQCKVSDMYVDPSQRLVFSNLVSETGRVSGFEQELKKKDGTHIWVQVTAQAVYQDNQVAYFDCTSMDITARKRETFARAHAEEALQQRTNELQALLDVANSANKLDQETVLNVVANRARNLLNATEATIFLLDEQYNLLRPIVALGDFVTERMGLVLRPGQGVVGWVAQHRQATLINHTITDPRVRHVPGTPDEDESILCAPLLHGEAMQGVILLNRIPAIGFTPNELHLLVGLAAQASGAIANARLYEETRRNALEQKIISEITRELNATLDISLSFPAVVKGLRALVDCDRISLALLDAPAESFTMVMLDQARPELASGTRLPIAATACAADIISRKIHQTPDLRQEISFPAEQSLYQAGYRSRVNIPLLVGERAMGALNLVSRQLDGFGHAPMVALQQIADTLAIALENTQLFQAEQTRREELGALYNLSRQLAELNSREEILVLVARHLVETIRVTFARIFLVEEGELVTCAAYSIDHLDQDLPLGQRIGLEQYPYLLQILRQNTPLIIQRNDPLIQPALAEFLFLDIGQTICLVPLLLHDQPIGLVTLGERRNDQREPFTPDKIRLAQNIGDQATAALYRVGLFAELETAYLQTVLALANAVDAKDTDTGHHSQQLSHLAILVGKRLGLGTRMLDDLRYGAILHDVGKIGVPDAILKKQFALNPDEWEQMHQHPIIGERILAPLPRLGNAAKIVRHHHERYDGTGYPDHLAGEAIPIGARILTLVDSYGAMIDRRAYKGERSQEQAIAEIMRCAGTQFDPHIAQVFLEILQAQTDLEPDP